MAEILNVYFTSVLSKDVAKVSAKEGVIDILDAQI